jgi:hypothetical protein
LSSAAAGTTSWTAASVTTESPAITTSRFTRDRSLAPPKEATSSPAADGADLIWGDNRGNTNTADGPQVSAHARTSSATSSSAVTAAIWFSPARANDRVEAGGADGTDPNRVFGGTGDDVVLGGANRDSLVGQAGNDDINGGVDNDKLYAGDDTFGPTPATWASIG